MRGWNFTGANGFGTTRGRVDVVPGTRVVGPARRTTSRSPRARSSSRARRAERPRGAARLRPRGPARHRAHDAAATRQRLEPVVARDRELPRATVEALRERTVVADRGRLSGPGASEIAPRGGAHDRRARPRTPRQVDGARAASRRTATTRPHRAPRTGGRRPRPSPADTGSRPHRRSRASTGHAPGALGHLARPLQRPAAPPAATSAETPRHARRERPATQALARTHPVAAAPSTARRRPDSGRTRADAADELADSRPDGSARAPRHRGRGARTAQRRTGLRRGRSRSHGLTTAARRAPRRRASTSRSARARARAATPAPIASSAPAPRGSPAPRRSAPAPRSRAGAAVRASAPAPRPAPPPAPRSAPARRLRPAPAEPSDQSPEVSSSFHRAFGRGLFLPVRRRRSAGRASPALRIASGAPRLVIAGQCRSSSSTARQ